MKDLSQWPPLAWRAVCPGCERPMEEGRGCDVESYAIDGQTYPRRPHEGDGCCHDCAVLPGQLHHLDCDLEECPRCSGQAITCGCRDD